MTAIPSSRKSPPEPLGPAATVADNTAMADAAPSPVLTPDPTAAD